MFLTYYCIHFENLELPQMHKLKVLELCPYQNHHQTKKFREISKFENCPNLEQLNIDQKKQLAETIIQIKINHCLLLEILVIIIM